MRRKRRSVRRMKRKISGFKRQKRKNRRLNTYRTSRGGIRL